ncbi:MAG TPA: hypothetical protein EYO58_07280, partial [Flavobacteriales bacterium]|nr:hypothetical protein [Flavobacteriales bacterium]
MQKNIVIELLQDREDVAISEQLLSNSGLSNSTDWDTTTQSGGCTVQWTLSGGVIIKAAGNCSYFEHTNIVLYEGWRYEIEIQVKDFNGSGSLLLANHGYGNSNITVINSTIIASGDDGSNSGSGAGQYAYIKTIWTQGASNLNKLRLYAHATTTMTITNIKLRRVAESSQTIVGRLDAATTEDFPLSIDFAIADSENIDVRKGAFSKTFKIPATDNNNKIFKHLNIPNSTYMDAAIYDKIPCRIMVGELFSLQGLLQLKDVERVNEKALLYSCVFLGDNLGWSTLLENKYLSDLQLANSTELELSAAQIVKTWQADDCENTTNQSGTTTTANTSPIVYPVAATSIVNETGTAGTMQLLRKEWEIDFANNNAYNISDTNLIHNSTPPPVVDWRPMVWIYNMIHKIFNDIGYRISSNFIESAEFKKLLYMTPNFLFNNGDARYQAYSYLGNFKDDSCSPANSTNQLWHKAIHRVSEYFNSGGWVGAASNYWTEGALEGQNFQVGGTCGSCSSTDCGSGRFQPAPSVIVNAGSTLQQETKIKTAG